MKRAPWEFSTIALFAFILLMPYLNQHWHLADDAPYGILNTLLLQARTLAEGMWPLWNPNVGLGTPWALVPGTGLYYPPQTLWGLVVGWSETKYLWYLYFHLVLGGLFAMRFARRTGLTESASIFFALAFIGNGLFIGFFSNPSLWVSYLYWPLLGIGLLELEQGEARRFRAISCIAVSLFVIQVIGYPLTKFLMFLSSLILYCAMVRKRGSWLRGPAWKPALLATAIAVLWSLPEWATTFQALHLSERLNSDFYDQALFHNVGNFLQLGTALFPSQFVARNQSQLGIMHLERSWWIGTLTLGFIFSGWQAQLLRFRGLGVALVICFFSFLFALGGHSFFRELFGLTLPIFMYLRQSHLGRQALVVLLIYLGAVAFSAFEIRGSKSKVGKAKSVSVPVLWLGFLILAAVLALTEKDQFINPRLLYQDLEAGWKVDLLHELFYLLLAYSAYAKGFLFFKSFRWPAALVALQFLCLADAGYALRRMIAEPGDHPIKSVEPSFRVASPQPNSRSTRGMFDGTDWYGWDGNLKSLQAYFAPRHKWLPAAMSDPATAPLLATLVSCQPVEGAPCQGVDFTIDYYFGNRILIEGHSSGPRPVRILVHDLMDPYWQAKVNGQELPIETGLNYFKSISVAPGAWKIDLEYRHPWFPWIWLSPILGTILLIASFFNCHGNSAGGKSRDGQSGSENPRRLGTLSARKRAR